MKFVLKTNFREFARFHKSILKRLALLLLLIAMFVGAAWTFGVVKPILRDFAVANIAHARAGDKIPFEEGEAGYIGNNVVNKGYTWGLRTNSVWMSDQIRLIVPYFAYEHVTVSGFYPNTAGIIPLRNEQSFHLGGRMSQFRGGGTMIILNERYIMDSRWNDKRSALSTLVHELIHVQRGAYLTGASAELETATQSATVEVLAAMCNHNNEVACGAFWRNIENWSRTSLELQLKDYGAEWLYNAWADMFWRDGAKQDSYYKSMRHWNEIPGELEEIQRKYSLGPWQNVINGVAYGIKLNTMHVVCEATELYDCGMPKPDSPWVCKVLGMPYDDAYYLMRGIVWILR